MGYFIAVARLANGAVTYHGEDFDLEGATEDQIRAALYATDGADSITVDAILADGGIPHTVEITKLQCKRQAVIDGKWDAIKSVLANNAEAQENWNLATSLNIEDQEIKDLCFEAGFPDQASLQSFFNAAGKT